MPRSKENKVRFHITLAEDVAAKLDLMVFDHYRNRPHYGMRSKLIETLLTQYFQTQERKRQEQPNA